MEIKQKTTNVDLNFLLEIPKKSNNTIIQPEQKATFSYKRISAADTKNPDVIRIGIFMRRYSNGGAERVTQILTTELAKRKGYEVHLITGKPTKQDYSVGEGVIRDIVSEEINQKKKDVLALKENKKIDVFLCQEYWAPENHEMIKFLKEKLCKVIALEHNFYFSFLYRNNFNIHQLSQESYKIADALCCLSKTDITLWKKNKAKASFYMPNPLTFDPIKIVPSKLDTKNILVVARFVKGQKEQHLAIEAMAHILKEEPNAKLQFLGAGPGKYQEECKDLCKKLGIEKSVEFCGFQTDIAKYYSAASAILVPSSFEGWGMQMIEAKAYGVPVVVMKMGYLETTRTGTINVGKKDVYGMARETIKLLQNKEYREEQGRLARESLNDFKTENTINKWDKLIRAVMQGDKAVQELLKKETPVTEEEAIRIAKEEFECAKEFNPNLVGKDFDLFDK